MCGGGDDCRSESLDSGADYVEEYVDAKVVGIIQIYVGAEDRRGTYLFFRYIRFDRWSHMMACCQGFCFYCAGESIKWRMCRVNQLIAVL